MPPIQKEEAPLLRKSYVIGLGVAAVICLLLWGPSVLDAARKWFATSEESPIIRIERGPAGAQENIAATNKELEAFQKWISGTPVPVIIVRTNMAAVDATLPAKGMTPRVVWPVPIQGTAYEGEWVAYCDNNKLRKGDTIYPSVKLCGYQVVGITRKCVWLMAYFTDQAEGGNYAGSWPDIGGIRLGLRKPFLPESVELRSGEFVRRNDTIVFQNGARLLVSTLWPQGAHFRLQSSGDAKPLDLVCIVVK